MFKARIQDLINRFGQGGRVLVVGDLTLDEFLTGSAERISREAPVLILRHETTRQIPGGAANALANLASLGVPCIAVGIVGQDLQGEALTKLLHNQGITSALVVDPTRPTVTKTRISAHSRQSVTQQIVRMDRKSDLPIDPLIEAQLVQHITQWLPQVSLVVCSDYLEGVLTESVIQACLQHPQVIVDTHLGLGRYRGATLFTPNLPEAEAAVGFGITSLEDLLRAGAILLDQTQAEQILITRGDQGMSLFIKTGEVHHIPAFNRTQVFDVTGAGDTVVAALTCARLAGATPLECVILGNLAASIVVRSFGTATTTAPELHDHLEQLAWTP